MTNHDSLQAICAELRSDHPFSEHNEFKAVLQWADRLERLDAEMRKELDTLYTRCYAAVSLIPGDRLVGDLQIAADELAELRARLAAYEDVLSYYAEPKYWRMSECAVYNVLEMLPGGRGPAWKPAADALATATQPTPDPNPSPSSQPYDAEGATVEHDPAKAKAPCLICHKMVHMDDADEHCEGHGR